MGLTLFYELHTFSPFPLLIMVGSVIASPYTCTTFSALSLLLYHEDGDIIFLRIVVINQGVISQKIILRRPRDDWIHIDQNQDLFPLWSSFGSLFRF